MKKILILPGDGIGKEVTNECMKIIDYFKKSIEIEITEELFGGASIDAHGQPLTKDVLDKAMESDAVLLGAVGGPKWEELEHNLKPEKGLLTLRKELEAFANLRPGKVFPALINASSLKKDIVDQSNLNITQQKWKDAFLSTPHGHPVKTN